MTPQIIQEGKMLECFQAPLLDVVIILLSTLSCLKFRSYHDLTSLEHDNYHHQVQCKSNDLTHVKSSHA